MKHIKKLFQTLALTALILVLSTTFASAINVADSDLSNSAGSNGSWYNIFWFLACVAFLLASAVIGSKTKYIKINRNYKGAQSRNGL